MTRFFGWDISTSCVGVCEMDESGQAIWFDHIDLGKEDDMLAKFRIVEIFVADELGDVYTDETIHFVEDRLAGFTRGFSNAGTLMKLGAFNFAVTTILAKRGRIEKLHPSTVKATMKKDGLVIAKSADKKKLTLDFAVKMCPSFPLQLNKNDNPKPFCFDMADAYITARAGYMRTYLSSHAQGKKAGNPPQVSGQGTDTQGK